jgi:hypothetical protein
LSKCKHLEVINQFNIPWQNGVPKRKIKTILGKKKLIGLGTKMLCNLWNEVVNIIMYLKNISPTIANFGITPPQMYFGKKLDLFNL